MRYCCLIIILAAGLAACNNLEDALPSGRSTFFRYYEGPYSLTAADVVITPSGYVILGNINVNTADTAFTQAVLINAGPDGNLLDDFHYYAGGSGKSIKPFYNTGTLAGYVVVGDSVYLDPFAEQAGNVEIISMRLLFVDAAFNTLQNFYLTDNTATGNEVRVDFSGEAVAVAPNGSIVVLGTRKANLTAPAEPFLLGIEPDFAHTWYMPYNLIPGRTGINGRSVQYINDKIYWTRSLSEVQGQFINSWISLPVVEKESAFVNDNALGEYTPSAQYFLSNDIAVASDPAFGFGITGTYSKTTDGSKGNIFFARALANGNFITSSLHFFDAALLTSNTPLTDSTQSVVVDQGLAITSTQDGGYAIAGTFTTVPGVLGHGGRDMIILKVNATGNLMWYRLHGGAGDDIPVAIKESPEGNLLIAGTHTLGNYSAIFLMKTNRNGELKN